MSAVSYRVAFIRTLRCTAEGVHQLRIDILDELSPKKQLDEIGRIREELQLK